VVGRRTHQGSAAAIPASLPPITSSRILTLPEVGDPSGQASEGGQLAEELLDAGVDVVADASHPSTFWPAGGGVQDLVEK
jgi:hypothetical protein